MIHLAGAGSAAPSAVLVTLNLAAVAAVTAVLVSILKPFIPSRDTMPAAKATAAPQLLAILVASLLVVLDALAPQWFEVFAAAVGVATGAMGGYSALKGSGAAPLLATVEQVAGALVDPPTQTAPAVTMLSSGTVANNATSSTSNAVPVPRPKRVRTKPAVVPVDSSPVPSS